MKRLGVGHLNHYPYLFAVQLSLPAPAGWQLHMLSLLQFTRKVMCFPHVCVVTGPERMPSGNANAPSNGDPVSRHGGTNYMGSDRADDCQVTGLLPDFAKVDLLAGR